jgi:membrane protein YqaA with SNARE-associated domain
MLEHLTLLVREYGLIGLFISSMAGSTIFIPFSVELTFPFLAAAGVSKYHILISATLGSFTGTLSNYLIGLWGIKTAEKHVKKVDVERAHQFMNKYGWAGLITVLAVPIPLPVDPITIVCGMVKMRLSEFTAAVIIGKTIKYAIILGLIKLLL